MQTPSTFQAETMGGLETTLPQNASNAGVARNLTSDRATGGWSTRVGYEPYVINPTNWDPFGSCGPITSLFVDQGLPGGARQHIFFEEGGNLHLLYEAGGTDVLRTLQANRSVPSADEPGSWYTSTPQGVVVTNGKDRPVIIKAWPLAGASESSSTIASCVRPFGFEGTPSPPSARQVRPLDPAGPGPSVAGAGGGTTLWCPVQGEGIPAGAGWGIGPANNSTGADGDQAAVYSWAVSFISASGSEGPISGLGSTRWALPASAKGFTYGVAVEIPTGPTGTVARKIYRTANYAFGQPAQGDDTLYFVDIIRNNTDQVFFDATRTTALGAYAPDPPLLALPSTRPRFSALHRSRLWIDGGESESTTLFYSESGLIEQFAADAFITLSSEGGSITGMFPLYQNLLVFRERSIDIIQQAEDGSFSVSTLSSSVTCRSPHSIAAVPGLGVVFLALDGVYAVTGGLEGGAVSDLVNVGAPIEGRLERLTADCLAKAWGNFSALTREYLLHVPTDGSDRPTLGLVLHVDRLASQPQGLSPWSTRRGFPVGCLANLYDGTVIFGHHTGSEAGGSEAQRGLFVLSGKRAQGKIYVDDVFQYADPPKSEWRSAWMSFGDPKFQKQVQNVTLWVLTTGAPKITMRHYKDFSLTAVLERTYIAQPPDASPLPELDAAVLAGGGAYTEARLVPLRFSIAHQSAAWWAFGIETLDDLVFIGFEVDFVPSTTLTIKGVRG